MNTAPVAVVTGAARGIGAATCLRLARAGWSVVAVDACADDPALPYSLASRSDLDALVMAADDAGGRECAAGVVADVRDNDALACAVALAEDRFGGVDAAIAVAGVIGGGVPYWLTDPDAERAVIDIDLGGVMRLARAAVPVMLRRPEPRAGRFVAVASAAAVKGLPNLAAYCAAKAGVVGFVRALASDLAGTGITANAVSPGSTRTDILTASAALYSLPDRDAFASQQAIHRLIDADEIAAVIEFLASPASGAVTGTAVAVDGGLTL